MSQRFSDRIGVTQPVQIQRTSMNADLEISLWNFILWLSGEHGIVRVARWLARYVLKKPVDEVPSIPMSARRWVKKQFLELQWFEKYNLVEELVKGCLLEPRMAGHPLAKIRTELNRVLERELSAFRLTDDVLTESFTETEETAIRQALLSSDREESQGAKSHLHRALELMGKKPNPDYRNSIKESISAVESLCKKIANDNKADLAKALKAIDDSSCSPALRVAFQKLYGWTGDEDGVRHAIVNEANVGFAEAKFMLVACSAFVNYLLAKSSEAVTQP